MAGVSGATDLNAPAVLGEHLEADGRAEDSKHRHENDVQAHLPGVGHQIENPAHTDDAFPQPLSRLTLSQSHAIAAL